MPASSPKSIAVVSVNTAPDRAKKVLGMVAEDLHERYLISLVGNSDSIEGVKPMLLSLDTPANLLLCASMWTPEQQATIQRIAKETVPGIKTYAIPTGLQVQIGPEGIAKHLADRMDLILEGN
ncbi:MAG: hypothetical protein CYPHOPRED_000735 [Cyphobasidiales sp. Tagirdzhanova-0007]|nr:MAG: hypothetical protein CYPHOPRED_000735 [Cyphobasidiales sp. Tagirdzhanova-0007]